MKIRIKWVDNAMFLGETESNHVVVMDGPADSGGRNMGPRPMEMMLTGLGGCTAFDVVNILKKSRQQVSDCVAEISAERSDEIPAVFTDIHIHFVLKGKNLKDSQVRKAIRLSADKYCSASIMLVRGGVNITHDYEILED
ncbi:MAG: OsmC family protein [Gammaproteobacteria bacterium]|nr:OsmC family protein [Gammaproteobacteria bacterium]